MRKILFIFFFCIISISTFAQSDTIKWDKYWYIKTYDPNQNSYLYEYQDTVGNILIPKGKYSILGEPDEFGYIYAWKRSTNGNDIENNVGFIDINDHILIPFNYSRTFGFSQNLACVDKNRKTGYIDRSGKIIIPFIYDSREDFHEDGVVLISKNDKKVLIDTLGNVIINSKHTYQEMIENFPYDHVLWIRKNDKWAFFDLKGNQLTSFIFDEMHPANLCSYEPKMMYCEDNRWFYKGILVIQQKNKYAVINTKMDYVIPCRKYQWISALNIGGVMIVKKNNKFGLLNYQLKLVQPIEFDTISNLPAYQYEQKFNSFWGKKNGKYFIFDSLGNWIDQIEYDSIQLFQANFYIVTKNGKTWRLDRNGIKVNEDFSIIRNDINGFLAKKNSKIGLIDFNGKIILPFDYDNIISENINSIFIKKNGKWGIISETNKTLLPCIYEYITYAWDDEHNESHNYVVVQNDKFGKVNSNGKELFPCIYDGITTWVEYGPNGHYVMIGDKMGLIDYNGNILVPIEFTIVQDIYESNWSLVVNGEKCGLYNKKEKNFFLPLEYNYIYIDKDYGHLANKRPTQIVTYKDGIINILDESGNIIRSNVSQKEIKKIFDIKIYGGPFEPCTYAIFLMIHNRTYKIPKCLEDEYKRSNIPLEHLFYEMKPNF